MRRATFLPAALISESVSLRGPFGPARLGESPAARRPQSQVPGAAEQVLPAPGVPSPCRSLLPTFLLSIPALTDQTTEPGQGLSVPLGWPREEARRQSERCLTPDPWLLASVAQGKPLRPQSFGFISVLSLKILEVPHRAHLHLYRHLNLANFAALPFLLSPSSVGPHSQPWPGTQIPRDKEAI